MAERNYRSWISASIGGRQHGRANRCSVSAVTLTTVLMGARIDHVNIKDSTTAAMSPVLGLRASILSAV